jgi:hypothetical protein
LAFRWWKRGCDPLRWRRRRGAAGSATRCWDRASACPMLYNIYEYNDESRATGPYFEKYWRFAQFGHVEVKPRFGCLRLNPVRAVPCWYSGKCAVASALQGIQFGCTGYLGSTVQGTYLGKLATGDPDYSMRCRDIRALRALYTGYLPL